MGVGQALGEGLQLVVELLVVHFRLVLVEVDGCLELDGLLMRFLREFLDGSLKLCHAVARALLHGLSLIQKLPQLHHLLVYLSLHALYSRYQLTASSGNLAFNAIDHAIKAFLNGLNPHVRLLSLYFGVFNGVGHGGQLLSCVLGGVIQGFTLLVLLLLKL